MSHIQRVLLDTHGDPWRFEVSNGVILINMAEGFGTGGMVKMEVVILEGTLRELLYALRRRSGWMVHLPPATEVTRIGGRMLHGYQFDIYMTTLVSDEEVVVIETSTTADTLYSIFNATGLDELTDVLDSIAAWMHNDQQRRRKL